LGTIQVAGNERRGRGAGEKFACFCGTKFWHAWSLKRHKQGCYAAIAMIEGGGNSSLYEEGIVPYSEG